MSAGDVRDPARPGPDSLEHLRAVAEADPAPLTMDGLCEQFSGVCQSAVDPLEIVSALEFDGVSDQMARDRYGYADVFALADEMYVQVPRQPAEPPPAPDPWHVSRLQPPLHGLLYGLPAVCFPAAAALLGGPGVHIALITALLSSWAGSQGLAALGFRRLGRTTDRDQARRVLRAGLGAGLALVTLIMLSLAVLAHARLSVVVFGIGEGAYMLGACVLLVLGAERWLLAVLAPGVLGSAAFLALGRPPDLEHAAWGALAIPPVAAVVAALLVTRPRSRPVGGRVVTLDEIGAAAPAVAFGLVAAGLLAFPVVAGVPGIGPHGINTGALLATLPLSLSMGAAEWCLLSYRRRSQALLRSSTDVRAFGRGVRLVLFAALAQYLAAAIALTAVAAWIALSTRLVRPTPLLLPELTVYLMLGCAMFLALALQALGLWAVPVVAGAAALAFEIGWRELGLAAQLAAVIGLLVILAVYAAKALAVAVRHAF